MSKSKKESVLNEIEETQKAAAGIEKNATEIAKEARFVQDLGEVTKTLVNAISDEKEMPNQDWEYLAGAWRDLHANEQSMQSHLRRLAPIYVAVSSGTTNTISSVIQSPYFIRAIPDAPTSQKISEQFYDLLGKDDVANEIKSHLRRLDLDTRIGEILSPIELFENAKSALDQPSGSEDAPVPITIQLRGCIDVILERLLKRRSTQEPTGNYEKKICSIGSQCGRDGLPVDFFSRLGSDATQLMKDLSATKDKARPRKEVIIAYQRSAQFIKALITSIDENKLRKLGS